MAFCFAFCRPLMTANPIPQRNCHFKRHSNNPHSKPLTKTPIIPHNHALRSLPLKHFNYESTSSSSLNDGLSDETPTKVRVLKHIQREVGDDPWESLEVIDALQRLRIDYLFQEEIDAILQSHHAISDPPSGDEIDLHKVALRFRLLRQQGYYVPADVFEIFIDKKGEFEEKLKEDIKGVASLYEASKLCMHGEEAILEKAANFAKETLVHTTATDPNHHLAKFVGHTLAHPHHRSPSAFLVKSYFGDTKWMNKWIRILQQAAKVEFNTIQALHQKEILQLTQWWEETGLGEECKFARNQPVVWYACPLGFFSDPCFSQERILLAKAISFVYLIDDIFDEYGTLHQLTLFTQAVSRWDMAGVTEELPDCMKLCLEVLYEITNEISDAVNQKHGHNPTKSLRKAWDELCKCFLKQAVWDKSGGKWPRAEEYLKNGIITTGFPLAILHAFYLLGEGVTHQTVELLLSSPDIVSSSAIILRLLDDIEAFPIQGSEDGYDASYIQYYMKEHEGSSIETTREHIEKLISDSWKTLNGTCLLPNPFPAKFIRASLSTVRIYHLISESKSDKSAQNLKKLMASVLFQKVDT